MRSLTATMLARGVSGAAKIAFSLMRQMFRFAVDRDLIEYDPTASIRKAKIGGKDLERDRVLNAEDLMAPIAATAMHEYAPTSLV